MEESDGMAFRVGGDAFIFVGLHLGREAAKALKRLWEEALKRLNVQHGQHNYKAHGCGKPTTGITIPEWPR